MKRRAALAIAVIGCLGASSTALASTVIVQGTTDIRDAGLLDDVIVPGFAKAYPQYTLKYIAVGTGQALTNARAGQGDAVVTHAPTQEADFVAAGYSYETFGRALFYSDYVILGPRSDPAGVLKDAPHNAAKAFELIAQAGAAGKAHFVSRGDNSGTNTEEKIIWGLANVPTNAKREPGSGASANPSWYHKAGLGQAATVQLTSQCPFAGGACYEITDRGTFNRLVRLKTVTNLVVVSERNLPTARGGTNLLVNSFHAYAVNPAKISHLNLAGATAFLDYLQSEDFQARLALYPTRTNPAFFADAAPAIAMIKKLPKRAAAGTSITIRGAARRKLPGGHGLHGATAVLQRVSGGRGTIVARATVGGDNTFTFTFTARRPGLYRVTILRFQDLARASRNAGRLALGG